MQGVTGAQAEGRILEQLGRLAKAVAIEGTQFRADQGFAGLCKPVERLGTAFLRGQRSTTTLVSRTIIDGCASPAAMLSDQLSQTLLGA